MAEEELVGNVPRPSATPPKLRYQVQPDGRAMLQVLVVVGDTAYAVTPWHTSNDPMALSAVAIAADCMLPLSEVRGREYTATGDARRLTDFRLAFDPRL